MNKKKIIISGGGTLGHILPIIPIVIELYNEYDFYYIGTKKGVEEKYFKDNNINKYFKEEYYLDMIGINRTNKLKNFQVLYKYFNVRKIIKKIYKRIKPNLIIGMGGYISGVCIKSGINKKIKTIIHEQNTVLGLANKLVYKKVDKVLLSYDINLNCNNKFLVGNPRYSYVLENYIPQEKNIILIVGGSIGSKYINDLIINNYQDFNFKNYIIKLVVGKRYYKDNKNLIEEVNKYDFIQIYDFLDNLIDEISNSSLIISRSGATTLSEIMALRKPSILIPSPNVTDNHQYYNALYYSERGCCEIIEEKDLSKDVLLNKINGIIYNYAYKKQIETNIIKTNQINPKKEFIRHIKEIKC